MLQRAFAGGFTSHPVWVRGLKQSYHNDTPVFIESHPVWVRGLKHSNESRGIKRSGVAPRVGAWIETQSVATLAASMMSHPVWVRGLKLYIVHDYECIKSSHPVWVRGLKLS